MDNSYSKNWFRQEDYWAIILGFSFLLTGIFFFYFVPYSQITHTKETLDAIILEEKEIPFVTVQQYEAREKLKNLSSSNTTAGKLFGFLLNTPKYWEINPIRSLYQTSNTTFETIEEGQKQLTDLYNKAQELQHEADLLGYQNQALNKEASEVSLLWNRKRESYNKALKKAHGAEYNLFNSLPLLAIFLSLILAIGAQFLGYGFKKFIVGFSAIFIIAVLSLMLGEQESLNYMGFGYAIWAIAIGLIISNTIGTFSWIKPAAQTEYYIKIGLVLLGAEILFGKILSIGLPGLFVAWIVTPVVLVVTFWFGQKILKITSKSLNITISADMSVCGVSAAIAAAAASKATKEELTMAVGLSMVFTSVMMVVMPAFINFLGMPEVLGGAWIGGTLDSTGAVVAAGAFMGNTALQVAATIKMIQNMLIGVIAFFIAYYFASKAEGKKSFKMAPAELWNRFPKFVLGFAGASIIFSLLYYLEGPVLGDAFIDQGIVRGFTKNLREWFFCFAFVSIGLSVNFKSLRAQFVGGKPLFLYVAGQILNLLLTLLMAWVMFYVVFPEIAEKL